MRLAPILFAIAIVAAMTGCGDPSPSTPAAPDTETAISEWPATRTTDLENFVVTIQPSDGPIERSLHFSLKVAVSPRNGGVIQEIKVDADMPGHGHGMNTSPETVNVMEGAYRTDGMLFHMAGDWVITVDIKSEAGTEKASFPVSIE